jgi:hypothetical protein
MASATLLTIGEPRVRLLGWFLEDQGVPVDEVTELDAACRSMHDGSRLVILNTALPVSHVAQATKQLRECADQARVVGIGPHGADDRAEPRDERAAPDVCIHASGGFEIIDAIREIISGEADDDAPPGRCRAA